MVMATLLVGSLGTQIAIGETLRHVLSYSNERTLAEEGGLPQAEIGQIAQSEDGYLWLGTWSGLVRFDGEHFSVYNHQNSPALGDDPITALATDRQGSVWAGTSKGLVRWDSGRIIQVDSGAGAAAAVTALSPATDGGLWVGTATGVNKVAGNEGAMRFAIPASSGGTGPSSVTELADGLLLVGTPGAWIELDPATGTTRPASDRLVPSMSVTAVLAADAQGRAWAVGPSGVQQRAVSGWVRRLAFPSEFSGEPSGIYADPAGGVVVWLRRWGVFHSDPDGLGFTRIAGSDPQSIRRAAAVLRDREQNLWVGGPDGLVRLHRRAATLWGMAQGLPSEPCWSAAAGIDGSIWVGTQSGLFTVPVDGPARSFPGPFQTNAVHLALPARDGRVWCVVADRSLYWSGTPDDPRSWTLLPLGDRRVRVLYESPGGTLWAGTDTGAVPIRGGRPVAFTDEDRLARMEVSAIFEDRSGAVWFGTRGGGVFRLTEGMLVRFFGPQTLGDDNIWAIHQDPEGGMWFGTNRGLTYHENGRWHQITRDNGLSDQIVHGIYEDAGKNLWLTGPRSVQRVWRPELEAVAAGGISHARTLRLGPLDGIDGLDLAGERQPCGAMDRSGHIWLPTGQGLLQLDPNRLQENLSPPPVLVEDASFEGHFIGETLVRRHSIPAAVDDPAVRLGSRMRIAQDQGHFVQFRFTANTFLQPRKTRFRFRLVGHDLEWREGGDNRTAMYANLRPGDYDFEVQAANAHGVWNTRGAAFRFSLVPRFYETRWFQGGCVFGLMGGGVGFARQYYRRRERRLEADRLALERERSRIARDLHDDLGANLTGLAMQAEISSYRLVGGAAQELLGFARASRSIAQRLREVIWAVDPECDTLRSLADFLAMQTEQMIGPTQIRYRFDAPEDLPDIRLRAGTRHQLVMAAREAVNNAIKYAKASEIWVKLELGPKDLLSISIRDDGVGLPSDTASGAPKPVVGGNGLNNMRQRLRSLGGTFRVSSAPGAGTLILLEVLVATLTAAVSPQEQPAHEHQGRDR